MPAPSRCLINTVHTPDEAAEPPPLNGVMLLFPQDWDVTYLGQGADYGADYTSRCIDMVYK